MLNQDSPASNFNLEATFHSLMERSKASHQTSLKFWTEIKNEHQQKNRHYHNLNHLTYLAELANQSESFLEDFDTLLFSIFYHDIVYNAKRKDNEAKSAQLAKKRLVEIGYPSEKIGRCVDQILATQAHQTSSDSDTNFLLDFDLAILGDSYENYKEYTKQVRREYKMYPDFLYKPRRKKVLQHFLDMEHIFKTNHFRKTREAKAKMNLQNEFDAL